MGTGNYSSDTYFASIMRELLSGRDVLSCLPARPGSAVFAAACFGGNGVYIAAVRCIPAYASGEKPPVPCFFADGATPKGELFAFLKAANRQSCRVLFVTPGVLLSDDLVEFASSGLVRAILAYDADVHIRKTSRVPGTLTAACDFRSRLPVHLPIAGFMLDFTPGAIKTVSAQLGGSPALFALPQRQLFGKIKLSAMSTANVPLDSRKIIKSHKTECGVVYCRTKKIAEITYNSLRAEFIPVALYHSELTAAQRKKAAADYAQGKTSVLVCTYGYSGDIWNQNTNYVIFAGLPYDIPTVCRALLTITDDDGEAIFVYSEPKPEETPSEQETELRRLLAGELTTRILEWYLY